MKKKWVIPIIVISQFFCTSLWFAGNAVLSDLVSLFSLPDHSIGHITSAVQLGFILGTLVYAIFTIADRFSPSRVFFISALLGATMNLLILAGDQGLISILGFRFLTGFFLAGIYPVGMKIASDYFREGLGKALGYLVGALVLGTALPHFIKSVSLGWSWKYVIVVTSLLTVIGGVLIAFVLGDGPFHRKGQKIDLSAFLRVFKDRKFRSPAFGYFGHMWELYAFWAFVPLLLQNYNAQHPYQFPVSLSSFLIIGIGFFSCIGGGYLSQRIGSRKTAFLALLLSGCCCLLSIWSMQLHPYLFFFFLLVWGMVVIADSPQFSTLVAGYAPPEIKGTALTIVNCIGFSITIFSIEAINYLSSSVSIEKSMIILGVGPVFGLLALGWQDS